MHTLEQLQSMESFVDDKGYVRIHYPTHPHQNRGYVYLHRCVMEVCMGRHIEPSEVVHHIDEDKLHNDIENLFLCSAEEHVAIHNRGRHNSLAKRAKISKGVQAYARSRKNERSDT